MVVDVENEGYVQVLDSLTVKMLTEPLVPMIVGGRYRKIGQDEELLLDGSQSVDPNGYYEMYRWDCQVVCDRGAEPMLAKS